MKLVLLALLVAACFAATPNQNDRACTNAEEGYTIIYYGEQQQCLAKQCSNYGNMAAVLGTDFISLEDLFTKTQTKVAVTLNLSDKTCGDTNDQECFVNDCFQLNLQHYKDDTATEIVGGSFEVTDSAISSYTFNISKAELKGDKCSAVEGFDNKYSCKFFATLNLDGLEETAGNNLKIAEFSFTVTITITDHNNVEGILGSELTVNQKTVTAGSIGNQQLGINIPAKLTVEGESNNFYLGDDIDLLFKAVDQTTFNREYLPENSVVTIQELDVAGDVVDSYVLPAEQWFATTAQEGEEDAEHRPWVLKLTLKLSAIGEFKVHVAADLKPLTEGRRVLNGESMIAEANVRVETPVTVVTKSGTLTYLLAGSVAMCGVALAFLIVQNRRLKAAQKAQQYTTYASEVEV